MRLFTLKCCLHIRRDVDADAGELHHRLGHADGLGANIDIAAHVFRWVQRLGQVVGFSDRHDQVTIAAQDGLQDGGHLGYARGRSHYLEERRGGYRATIEQHIAQRHVRRRQGEVAIGAHTVDVHRDVVAVYATGRHFDCGIGCRQEGERVVRDVVHNRRRLSGRQRAADAAYGASSQQRGNGAGHGDVGATGVVGRQVARRGQGQVACGVAAGHQGVAVLRDVDVAGAVERQGARVKQVARCVAHGDRGCASQAGVAVHHDLRIGRVTQVAGGGDGKVAVRLLRSWQRCRCRSSNAGHTRKVTWLRIGRVGRHTRQHQIPGVVEHDVAVVGLGTEVAHHVLAAETDGVGSNHAQGVGRDGCRAGLGHVATGRRQVRGMRTDVDVVGQGDVACQQVGVAHGVAHTGGAAKVAHSSHRAHGQVMACVLEGHVARTRVRGSQRGDVVGRTVGVDAAAGNQAHAARRDGTRTALHDGASGRQPDRAGTGG